MPLEQEVSWMLICGFSIIMGVTILTTLFLMIKKKSNIFGFGFTLMHLVFSSIVFYFIMKVTSFDYTHLMASEEISLHLGIAGVVWAIGMLSLMLGIYNFTKLRMKIS
ncbi:hypothetical protein FIU87_03480 [Bacillus sp. THAF10]|uniref:hypothetical protein n=1 Tax=Bacillus sp. THAF10 TaxID=2587848 RepID=UPI0012696EBC|nr:hypothetical protein [Bacillus sp. THAF10]QFT87704.1 hypothetical protein FIU87_03480 [Bacillus sp. THAF10]